ncbi:hypothetical protein MTR67_048995 [Solanum verrucosum]|uniref:Uncharacterized protein n=1 Tax=Solanum verrucosum TaxID=315347 RepID=A0AAF1A061_SOLVR|nr:hypothetical protein MTR67_048995 [Solanum verrucosum]
MERYAKIQKLSMMMTSSNQA